MYDLGPSRNDIKFSCHFWTTLKPGQGGLDSSPILYWQYIIRKLTSSSTYTVSQIFRMPILPIYDKLPNTCIFSFLRLSKNVPTEINRLLKLNSFISESTLKLHNSYYVKQLQQPNFQPKSHFYFECPFSWFCN